MSRQREKLEELSRLIEAAKTMPLKEDPAYKEPEFDKLYRLSFRVGNYGIVELKPLEGSNEAEVYSMALCNTEQVCLRPYQLYRFYVVPSCKRCKELASPYYI